MKTLLWIALGGSAGSVARALSSSLFAPAATGSFPFATLFVNIVGSCIIGLIYGRIAGSSLPSTAFVFLTTGFCGGFTTFSAFSIETVTLIRDGHVAAAVLYAVLSVVLGVCATMLGLWMARWWN